MAAERSGVNDLLIYSYICALFKSMKQKTGPKPRADRNEVKQWFSIGIEKKFGTIPECKQLIYKLLAEHQNKS
jgi:hypothetical protein